jgi:hypothetical protein
MEKKTHKDLNQLAKSIMQQAIGEEPKQEPPRKKNPANVKAGRLGGLKGGKARKANLSSKRRKEIAKKAIEARWGKKATATG